MPRMIAPPLRGPGGRPSLPPVLLALLLVLAPSPTPARAAGAVLGPAEVAAMVQALLAMIRVWNSMQGVEDFPPSGWPLPGGPGAWQGWPAGVPGPGGAMPGMPGGMVGGLPGGSPAPGPGPGAGWPLRGLQGRWVASDGSMLWFAGMRFGLQVPGGTARSGWWWIAGGELWFLDPAGRTLEHLRIRMQGPYLLLEDEYGRRLVWRRVE